MLGQRHRVTAQQEGAFGVGQWPFVVPEAVGVVIAGQFPCVVTQGAAHPWVVGRQAAAHRR